MDQLEIVVVGAGIGGLGSALALARAGHAVTLVERDDTPMPADVEDAFEWDRRGAPQVRHPHVFLGLAGRLLREHFPDVSADLAGLGVVPAPMTLGPATGLSDDTVALLAADPDLRLLPCRRTTFEWVMRRHVLAEPGITPRFGLGVAGLVVDTTVDGPPRVTGVRLEDGVVLDADVVVATTGRRGDVPSWLAEHDIEIPETSGDAGVVYFSRFYRSPHDEGFGFRGGFGAGLIAGVIGADAGTFSVTAVVDKADRELRAHLNDSERFDATMRLLPELGDVTAAGGVPVHPVHCMTGLINRTRSFTTADGAPRVVGLLACGDAHTCTNPAYGRGQSLALRQALLLTEALGDTSDLAAAAGVYESRCTELVEPWYHFSVLTDQMRMQVGQGAGPRGSGADLFGVFSGAAQDPELVRTLMRVMNLLDSPQALLAKLPELQAAASAAPIRPKGPRVKRPSRDELLGVVA